jgi:hypothetical protein
VFYFIRGFVCYFSALFPYIPKTQRRKEGGREQKMEKKEIRSGKGLLFSVLLALIVLCSTSVFGATIRVPTDYPTIQAGIDAAAGGDIVIVADGTFVGSGNKDLDFNGKAITVKSENGPENCIIDCQGNGRGFYFHSGETQSSVLSGFTITNGSADYDSRRF